MRYKESQQVAAQILKQMATHDASEAATTVEASVSDDAAKWNQIQKY